MSRRSEAAAYWERSDHALEWARKFIGLGEHAKSVQDSYSTAFYAAKAALAQLNIRSKYHTSVLNRVKPL
ncbi:MAG: HEPN domain-containing protein [bacterium]|nr:HEPN domain-containing protein [bacterium]